MSPATHGKDGAAMPRRRLLSRRTIWHTIGLVLAALLTWLLMRAYRDPALILELSSWRLC